MSRRIQAPGVEINEIDRSGYGQKPDYALPNAPAMLVTGFADKGPDYVLQWINSPNTLVDTYGYPTNEAEKYFYNAQLEILSRGGYCIAAKLPYYNKSKDKYAFVGYTVDSNLQKFYDVVCELSSCKQDSSLIGKTLYDFLLFPNIETNYLAKSRECARTYVFPQTIPEKRENVGKYYYEADLEYCSNQVNLSKLFERNKINLDIIEDFIMFVDDKCNFEIEDRRAFNSFFYDELDYVNPNAIYLLRDIYENTTIDDMCKNHPNLSSTILHFEQQIYSMRQTMSDIEDIPDFSTLMVQFAYAKGFNYFSNYINGLIYKIEHGNYASGLDLDEYVLLEALHSFKLSDIKCNEYMTIKTLDSSLSSYRSIYANDISSNGKISFDLYDRLVTGESLPPKNQFYIVDKTRQQYSTIDLLSGDQIPTQKNLRSKDILGIVPIVTTPTNALFFQSLIDTNNEHISSFNVVSSLVSLPTTNRTQFVVDNSNVVIEDQNFAVKLQQDEIELESISKMAVSLFPQIKTKHDNYIDREFMHSIGVVVLKAFEDTANNHKIGFTVLESYVGSLDKDAVDATTQQKTYIGNLVNGNSKYISFFSNVDVHDDKDEFDTYLIKNQMATSLGFYKFECEKDISAVDSISNPLNIILDHSKNAYELPLDAIVDAGVSNIAQFIRSVYWKTGYGKYTFNAENLKALKNVTSNNVGMWKNILVKFDNFCKEIRMCRDCMFIADGLRHLCLYGNSKRVRPSNIHSSFMKDVFPGLKYMQALDSSYSAGYCNWYMARDDYSGDMLWLPPSIKAAGVYIYTDTYFHTWDAPAGLTRGVLANVYDVAFNPTIQEAGKLYNQQWNYAISYPIDGIVVEGQKTFQINKTALDRINVRRLMLYLEKEVVRIGRHFLYESNTEYLRQRFVDALTPIFEDCENGNGIIEFAIKCDDENNTLETIENHELHVKIAVKPVKTLEFLVCDFIVTNQSASVSEEVYQA